MFICRPLSSFGFIIAVVTILGLLAGCAKAVPALLPTVPAVIQTPVPTPTDYPRTVTDAFGTTTTIKSAARVVALMSPVSDNIFGLGEGHRVVGRTMDASWPPGVI